MDHNQLIDHSPLAILHGTPQGLLGSGQLGVVTARAGVGKTAFLVQVGLHHLISEHKILHVALEGQTVGRVKAWYDTLFDDLANVAQFSGRTELKTSVDRGRLIQAYNSPTVSPDQIERTLALYATHLAFKPSVIIIDGFDWSGDLVKTAAAIGALKASATRMGAALWISARSHRDAEVTHALGIAAPCDAYASLIDVAVDLTSKADYTSLRLLKNRGETTSNVDPRNLQSDTMRSLKEGNERSTVSLPAGVCMLLSGGAKGAEEAFGQLAERWGLGETHFSFKDRPVARSRGVVLLSDEQLQQGRVTARYLQQQLHRTFPDTPLFQKVLQSIWHQVNTAGQVFVVGLILEDGTVKGGTGWAAELAKHLGKELYVYDQERRGWSQWADTAWTNLDEAPRITCRRFTGTGSRFLSDHGRDAIESLFRGSFGEA